MTSTAVGYNSTSVEPRFADPHGWAPTHPSRRRPPWRSQFVEILVPPFLWRR
jgi:hypothetical protein